MLQQKMPKLVSGREPLDAHRPFSGNQHARIWLVQECAKQTLKWAQQQWQANSVDGTEHIDRSTAALNLLAEIEVTVQASRRHCAGPDGSGVIRRHLSAPCRP